MFSLPRVCGWMLLLLACVGRDRLSADTNTFGDGSLRYDWLKPAEDQRLQSEGGTYTSGSGLNLNDPFAVISGGSLWQDKQVVGWSRSIIDQLSLNCSTSRTTEDGAPDSLGSDLRAGTTYKPLEDLSVQGNVHSTSNDQSLTPTVTSGAGATAESHLPFGSVLTVGANADQAHSDSNPGLDVATDAYDAQLQKPVGKLPLQVVLKGHYAETQTPGATTTKSPSLEQSLVWKPLGETTTLQAGLRQQQYQNIPGVNNQLNEALFADWAQKIGSGMTWHSYAEMINMRSDIEIAQVGQGANGTAQPNAVQGGTSLGTALPVTTADEKLTFSTGPSFKLQKDISASLEYSNSWDQSPAAGNVGQEQRVSVSLKGTF